MVACLKKIVGKPAEFKPSWFSYPGAVQGVLNSLGVDVGFIYTAYKTRSLVPSILFHFLHDTFLFVVQVSRNAALSNAQDAVFFVSLWVSIGVWCLATKVSAKRFGVQEKEELYKNVS